MIRNEIRVLMGAEKKKLKVIEKTGATDECDPSITVEKNEKKFNISFDEYDPNTPYVVFDMQIGEGILFGNIKLAINYIDKIA